MQYNITFENKVDFDNEAKKSRNLSNFRYNCVCLGFFWFDMHLEIKCTEPKIGKVYTWGYAVWNRV